MKRNNDEIGMNQNFESNNSDDENNAINESKWAETKRRRETSPCNIKNRDSPINEEIDRREKQSKSINGKIDRCWTIKH